MSGQGGAFSQPHWRTNRNERSRDRFSREDGKFSRNRSSSRGKRIPHGLKGRDIGMYFRDKSKKSAEERIAAEERMTASNSSVIVKADENMPLEHQKILLDERLKSSGVIDAAVSKRSDDSFNDGTKIIFDKGISLLFLKVLRAMNPLVKTSKEPNADSS